MISVSSVMKDRSHLRWKIAMDLFCFFLFSFVAHFKSLLQVHLTIKQKHGLRGQLIGISFFLSLHILSLSSYSYPGCSTSTS